MSGLAPLALERSFSRRLWGGTRLAGFLGVPGDAAGEPLAESWQVYSGNLVADGPHAGRSLASLAAELGPELLGSAATERYGRSVPLLAKFIDAAEPLSIQVHPDDAYAAEHEAGSGHLGKAEAWYVLDCAPGASVLWGWRHGVSEEEVRRLIESGTLPEAMNRVAVAPGDVIHNPAGTVHAIGAGIFLFEIQQSSDLTYRLYDYGRTGVDGRPRELHVDRALRVADLSGGGEAKVLPALISPGRRRLVANDHFVMESLEPSGDREQDLATDPASLEILTAVRGVLRVEWEGGDRRLPAGESLVLPAALGNYRISGHGEVLRCFMPHR